MRKGHNATIAGKLIPNLRQKCACCRAQPEYTGAGGISIVSPVIPVHAQHKAQQLGVLAGKKFREGAASVIVM